jgi:hypothetical protein
MIAKSIMSLVVGLIGEQLDRTESGPIADRARLAMGPVPGWMTRGLRGDRVTDQRINAPVSWSFLRYRKPRGCPNRRPLSFLPELEITRRRGYGAPVRSLESRLLS